MFNYANRTIICHVVPQIFRRSQFVTCSNGRYLGVSRLLKRDLSRPSSEKSVSQLDYDIQCISCDDDVTKEVVMRDMLIYNDFITPEEEESLFSEVEPYLKRMRYEYDHWDNVSKMSHDDDKRINCREIR